MARSSTPLLPEDTNATTAPESVGTSASSLKRISVSVPSSRDAYSYSSRSSSSPSDTDPSSLPSWRAWDLGSMTRCRIRSDFDEECVALAAAGADRGEAEAAAVAAQVVHHRAEDAAAARADRMAESDRAAVDVRGLRVRAEHRDRVERDRGERLVHLDPLHVADRLARLLERLLPRIRRRACKPRELVRNVALRHDRRQRLEPAPLRELLRAHDDARRAVVDAGRVPCSDGPLGIHHRLQSRELLE